MTEDMTIRKIAQKTQHDNVQRVKDFASYLKRPPRYSQTGRCRRRLSGAFDVERRRRSQDQPRRFFFKVTLDRPDLSRHDHTRARPSRLC
jgi:integrase/recombinase XerD